MPDNNDEFINTEGLAGLVSGLKPQPQSQQPPTPPPPPTNPGSTQDTPEQIQAKVDALGKKDNLSDQEKQFLKDHKGATAPDTLTDEQVQTKLGELGEKEEKDYTDEDRAFITKYTSEPEDDITFLKSSINQKYGIDLKDKKYANDATGFAELTDDVATYRAQQLLEDHFQQAPIMAAFYNHVMKEGMSVDTFLQKSIEPAFKKIKLEQVGAADETAKAGIINRQKQIIKMDLLDSGRTEEEADELAALYEDKGENTLYEKAKASLTRLEQSHGARIDAKIKADEAARLADQAAMQEEIRKVDEMITKNNFDGLSIPPADIPAFKNSMLRADANGYTHIDYLRSKLTLAQRGILDYIIFKQFKGIGLSGTTTSSARKFAFVKKANKDNDVRAGGRVGGLGDGSQVPPAGNKPNIQAFIPAGFNN